MEQKEDLTGCKDLTICKVCTRHLNELATQKSKFFMFFCYAFKCVMRIWVNLKRIDLKNLTIRSSYCENCNRFYKNALGQHSDLFVRVDNKINPLFVKKIEKLVGTNEIEYAKVKAKNITSS